VDFGSAVYEKKQFYKYIQSRYYRAPQILLGCLPFVLRLEIGVGVGVIFVIACVVLVVLVV
jgi:hypothetical protein